MKESTQIGRVERALKREGYVSRNFYLDVPTNKITRLSHIILKLREKGLDITTETTERDTIYHLKAKRVETYKITETGEVFTKKIFA